MKIALISPYPDITSFGLRTISAFLRARGHETRLIFLPDPLGDDLISGARRYPQAVLDDLAGLCGYVDLVGVGLMTNYFDNAVEVTAALKQAGCPAPVVWGGVHATIRPGQCLEHADYVCVGDGEEALAELAARLAAGQAVDEVAGIWMKRGEAIIRNHPRPLTQDLDLYPRPDWSHQDHWVMDGQAIVPLTPARTAELLSRGTVSQYLNMPGYQTMTGRGCPHKCSYCINDALKELYGAKGYLRWRSAAHVMDELRWAKEHLPFIRFVWISDDAFFARPLADIRDFCARYKAEVGLPFSALASPLTMSEEKMALLVDAGLVYLQMGVQTGSARIQELFNRKQMNNQAMLRAMHIIHKFQASLFPTSYDFILDVPWETEQDKLESIKLIAQIPRPYRLQPFSLVLYPGTKLHIMAAGEGLICDEEREIYTKSYTMRAPTYLNLLITLAKGGRLPGGLLRALSAPGVVRVMNSPPLRPVVKNAFLAMKIVWGALKRAMGRG